MKVINLENLEGLPEQFLVQLSNFNHLFKKYNHLENFERETGLQDIILHINNIIETNTIIAYHYTRANPDEIFSNGLLCRSGSEIRESFLEKYGTLFTSSEMEIIHSQWKKFFATTQKEARDNRIFFNFTQASLNDLRAEPLLRNFGGEQIHMPLKSIQCINDKIKKIGIPLILKCKLNPTIIKTYINNPWGQIAVSSYHRYQNPNAATVDQDGYQSVNVPPENIEIIECKNI